MNTYYQTVAIGTLAQNNNIFVEGVDEARFKRFRQRRTVWQKKIEGSAVTVDITTEFPDYQSLGEGGWRHQIVGSVYREVVARTNSCLKHIALRSNRSPKSSARVYLVWERLHDNATDKPVYTQRWCVEKEKVALLGRPGRLGKECFGDIILAAWYSSDNKATNLFKSTPAPQN